MSVNVLTSPIGSNDETNSVDRAAAMTESSDNGFATRHLSSGIRFIYAYGNRSVPFAPVVLISPLDGASVREAHCAQASTAVRRTIPGVCR